MPGELFLIQKALLTLLTCISTYILLKRIICNETEMYIDWQFPMLLALLIDIYVR